MRSLSIGRRERRKRGRKEGEVGREEDSVYMGKRGKREDAHRFLTWTASWMVLPSLRHGRPKVEQV